MTTNTRPNKRSRAGMHPFLLSLLIACKKLRHAKRYPAEQVFAELDQLPIPRHVQHMRCPYCFEDTLRPGEMKYLDCACLNVDLICASCCKQLDKQGNHRVRCLNRKAARVRSFGWPTGETRVSVLHVAAALQSWEMVRYLVGRRGFDLNACTSPSHWSPTLLALSQDSFVHELQDQKRSDVLSYLIQAKADFNLASANGETPLSHMCLPGYQTGCLRRMIADGGARVTWPVLARRYGVYSRDPRVADCLFGDDWTVNRGFYERAVAERQWNIAKYLVNNTRIGLTDLHHGRSLLTPLMSVPEPEAIRLVMLLIMNNCFKARILASEWSRACKARNTEVLELLLLNKEMVLTQKLIRDVVAHNLVSVLLAIEHLSDALTPNIKNQLLVHACRHGKIPVVEWLLKHNAEVNHRGPEGCTPLHVAVRARHKDRSAVVYHLLKSKADVEVRTNVGFDAREPDGNTGGSPRTKTGMTPLMLACQRSDSCYARMVVCQLLNAKADASKYYTAVDPRTKAILSRNAGNPLSLAVAQSTVRVVQTLLVHGADVNEPVNGEGVLSQACRAGQMDIVMLLLAVKANIDTPSSRTGRTALDEASSANHTNIVELLLEKKKKYGGCRGRGGGGTGAPLS